MPYSYVGLKTTELDGREIIKYQISVSLSDALPENSPCPTKINRVAITM